MTGQTVISPTKIIQTLWSQPELPHSSLAALRLAPIEKQRLASSYKIADLAQASIALSTLVTSLIQSKRIHEPLKPITVNPLHAIIEFSSEKYTWLDDNLPPPLWGPLSGLYECADGHVRLHDSFHNHRKLIVDSFGCEPTKESLQDVLRSWKKGDVEVLAEKAGFAAYALRSEEEWSRLEQSKQVEHVIELRKRSSCPPSASSAWTNATSDDIRARPLAGLRVIELSRVLAAPVAGRTLACHGAEVIWVTSPNLPDLPGSDRDVSRGKRTVQLDLDDESDRHQLKELVKDADVFIQSYRPGSMERRGFGAEELRKINPGLIYANLSAWGPGPWAGRRGFDSLVQTATGFNVSEALAAGKGEVARPFPCQALDHSAGYLLAAGIQAAVIRRMEEGGGWDVNVYLQGCMDLLKSLGRVEDGFEEQPYSLEDVQRFLEERQSGLGLMKAVTHAGRIEGCQSGFDHMPKPLGSDEPVW